MLQNTGQSLRQQSNNSYGWLATSCNFKEGCTKICLERKIVATFLRAFCLMCLVFISRVFSLISKALDSFRRVPTLTWKVSSSTRIRSEARVMRTTLELECARPWTQLNRWTAAIFYFFYLFVRSWFVLGSNPCSRSRLVIIIHFVTYFLAMCAPPRTRTDPSNFQFPSFYKYNTTFYNCIIAIFPDKSSLQLRLSNE